MTISLIKKREISCFFLRDCINELADASYEYASRG